MKFDEFVSEMSTNMFMFMNNLSNSSFSLQERSPEEWMKIYLRYIEWQTDMHDEYWKEDENDGR